MEKWIRRLFKKKVRRIEIKGRLDAMQNAINDMKSRPYMRKTRRRALKLYKWEVRSLESLG